MQISLFSSPMYVSQLTALLRKVVDEQDDLKELLVQGEISNPKFYPSGHFYFSLKDANASIRCVMWKGQVARLTRESRLPREGEAVNIYGRISVYETRGEVQFTVDSMELLGAGALWQEFEKLKQKLANEGLFDEGRKRPLPKYPKHIGIVTSRSGAVIQDMRHILERRYPICRVYLANTAVQGADAPPQIVAALKLAQSIPDLDVIILARGGGSIEDLWAFNDERVARAICASRVPIISGVGHETDFTIADFCADLRAPTPTAAAQFCTPDQNELRANLLLFEQRLQRAISENVLDARRRLIQDVNALHRASPYAQIEQRRQRIDDLTRHATRLIQRRLEIRRAQWTSAVRQLNTLNPLATLERGYAIVRQDQTVITDANQVSANDTINIRVRNGEFTATVK